MFESIPTDGAPARLRPAALPPLGALLLAGFYLTIYPLLGRVPAFLFWSVALVLLAGAILGAVAIVRAVRRERPHGKTVGWLVCATAVELLCARLFLSLTLPWL